MKKRDFFSKKIKKSGVLLAFVAIMAFSLTYLKSYRKSRASNKNKHIVVIIPSYNNMKWYEKNLSMLAAQEKTYKNWKAIYIDDCSKDDTGQAVEHYIKKHNLEHKIKLIKNTVNKGAMYNLYHAIHSCKNGDIVVTLDGDDWFKDEHVLSYINQVYQDKNVWMTYGQYEIYPSGKTGHCQKIPDVITSQNAFRKFRWLSSHLRTFYAGLFKKIAKKDLLYENKFYAMTWDMAMMFPMLEMAGKHAVSIDKVLYVYNQENPINDWKKDLKLVLHLEKQIRGKEKYNKIHAIT
ncbi:glycosyltransferase family 2 protein [Candidatus Dependentiae bacterium]